ILRSLTPLLVVVVDAAFRKQPYPKKLTFIKLNTMGFVFYNNFLSLMMAPFFRVLSGECGELFTVVTRKAIFATTFTVTGVVNKFLIVLINVLIWDKHATLIGLVCLLSHQQVGFCISSSVEVERK
ncbi:hypothetical protein Goari_026795, partial [Gossypium aridum]|nr:hypothetical protein [Gossypium aridum]